MTTSENPYAAPQIQPPPPPEPASLAEPRPVPPIGKSFLKWTLACGIAAAPSFFFGSNLVHRSGIIAACGGMIDGIIVFIVLYVFAERTQRVQQILSWRFARRTAWIGYGTRVAASIFFPVGIFVDVFCGVFSVSISNWFLGAGQINFRDRSFVSGEDQIAVFAEFMLTTIVQGILLNVVLFGFMILVFGICHLIGSFKKPRR